MNDERSPIGKFALIALVLFEAGMLVWYLAISDGSYDPVGPPAAINLRNPMGSLGRQMAQIEARQNFIAGFFLCWAVGTVLLSLFAWLTRPRVFISKDR
jgi:hypothetical protein